MKFSDAIDSIRRARRAYFGSQLVCALLLLSCTVRAQESDQPPPTLIPTGPYRIAGTVVNAKTGSPLVRTRVTISATKQRQSIQSVITGDEGRFEFHVPAGKYTLSGAKRGFIASSYDQHERFSTAIVTAADLDTESLVLRLQPDAAITGRVLDEFQEPVRDADVMLYRETHFQGVSRIEQHRGATTNDEGRYEITPLDAGTYFIGVKAAPWYAVHPDSGNNGPIAPSQVDPSLDVAYPVTYYGDTTETDSAVPIPVRGGDRLEADIHLNPVQALHFIVHVPETSAREGYFLPTLQKATLNGFEQAENTSVRQISEGVFEISGVAAGRYTVRMPDASGTAREASDVDLTSSGEIDVSSGSLTSTVKIRVQIPGATEVPPQMHIGLRNSKGRANTVPVDDKGEASFVDVSPGKYDIIAGSRERVYSVTRIASESGAMAGHTLNVPAGAALNLSLTLVGGSVAVEGVAKRDGKAAAGAMIVLVPKEADADRSRFRRDQSDLDGSFTLPNVIPGTYTLVAIKDGWDLNWSEPGVLAQYVAHGQMVEIGDRTASPMRLADAVEAQGK